MSETEALTVEALPGVHVWHLRHAPVNGIGPTLIAAMHACLTDAIADRSVAAIVLVSDLRVFSAGADATWMGTLASSTGSPGPTSETDMLSEFIATMDRFRELSSRLRSSPLLTIAVIEGHALAGGLELAAACDLRYGADDEQIKIGVPEMELFGQLPDGGGGVQFLTRLMGASRALQFILDAGPVPPRQAQSLGLLDSMCPPAEVRARAIDFAAAVARRGARLGVAAAKQAVFTGNDLPLGVALDVDRSLHWAAMRQGDFAETVQRFVDRFASKEER